jgi:hypothetical protein
MKNKDKKKKNNEKKWGQNKSETQTRRELSWGKAIWGPTDRLMDGQTSQKTDVVFHRGAILMPENMMGTKT